MGEPQRVFEIFDAVVELQAVEQAARLGELCAGDSELRQQVERMLEAHDIRSIGEVIGDALGRGRLVERAAGQTIGPYRILKVLGEGGFGVVYLAEQRDPVLRRVALKLIKPELLGKAGTGTLTARFELERETLKLLAHPNIAKIYDAGTTDGGIHYFAMEYVPGDPITRFCDEHKLDIKSRLQLFQQVCQAVQHAHDKGIIHRDLSPSNVLVAMENGEPVPKVIDFGVAKAVNPEMVGLWTVTVTGQVIGKLEYMSPEQAKNPRSGVDIRSDVYSLGVMLYEVLTGVRPFDLKEEALHRMVEVIDRVDPLTPSSMLESMSTDGTERLHSIARSRQLNAQSLGKLLRKELEWIPLMAMRKEPQRRYRNAGEIADDIVAYLEERALRAGPVSRWYRLKKAIHQHRGPVAAVATVIIVLTISVVVTAGLLKRAVAAEQEQSKLATEKTNLLEAQTRLTERANALATSEALATEQAIRELGYRNQAFELLRSVLGKASPIAGNAYTISIRDVLVDAIPEVMNKDLPATIRADMLLTLGGILRELSLRADAERALMSAQEVLSTPLGPGESGEQATAQSASLIAARVKRELALTRPTSLATAALLKEASEELAELLGPRAEETVRAQTEYAEKYAFAQSADEKWGVLERQWLPVIAGYLQKNPQDLRIEIESLLAHTEELIAQGMTQDAVDSIVRFSQPAIGREFISRELPRMLLGLAARQIDLEMLGSAEACARAAVQVAPLVYKERDGYQLQVWIQAACVLYSRGHYAEAASLLLKAYELSGIINGQDHVETRLIAYEYLEAYGMAAHCNGFAEQIERVFPQQKQSPGDIAIILAQLGYRHALSCMLAEVGGDEEWRDQHGLTILQSAIVNWSGKDSESLGNPAYWSRLPGAELTIILEILHDIFPATRSELSVALYHAARVGSLDSIPWLLNAGAVANDVNADGLSALHASAWLGNASICVALVNGGADVDIKASNGRTPLFDAALRGHTETCATLIDLGADINAEADDGRSPLHYASLAARTSVIELLVSKGARIDARDEEGDTPLISSLRGLREDRDTTTAVKTLVGLGADVRAASFNGKTAMHWAADQKASQDILQILLKSGADPNAMADFGETPLYYAATVVNDMAVHELIEAGADINLGTISGKTPLMQALNAFSRDRDSSVVVKILLEKGANVSAVDKDGWTALHWAINSDASEQFVQAIIDNGANVDARSATDRTPLHYAVLLSGIPNIKTLLSNGASVNAIDSEGETSLIKVFRGNLESRDVVDAVQALIDYRIDVRLAGLDGWTALHWAANLHAPVEAMQLLIEAGADVNAAALDGKTPLHASTMGTVDNLDAIRLLLDSGADPLLRDEAGNTASDYADTAAKQLLSSGGQ